MYKKILSILLFFLIAILSFGSVVEKVRFNEYPPQMVFDLSQDTPAYSTDYDEYNRLLFLDIGNNSSSLDKTLKNGLPKYIEKFQRVDYGTSSGFFITLNKNIFHKVSLRKSPNRVVVDFSKSAQNKQYTVVIDPGHGGKDPGASGINGTREKDIALAVGKYLRDELTKDFNVVMTRDTDEFITLTNRSKISNGVGADLFISVHINSAESSKLSGMEIFYFSKKSSPYAERIADFENSVGAKYGEDTNSIVQIMGQIAYNKNQEKSIKLAEKLNKDLSARMNMKDRGIHGANFAVLRGISSPGILIELGFIRNPEDHRKMTNKTNQKIMAQKIAEHVRKYFY
ncbi:N-acetylmuramoyl-L-alanine amidase [Fusobacterium sp.]|uniref:N-acetylmuramoyl-L-alanine amidase family protein n=1 Tax=Fusobacterium sp. TaxID=68766 RepID=UPI0026191055|nr:N-acetylmuramoyl-L-alanine amidase [Fusobacterium sp.]